MEGEGGLQTMIGAAELFRLFDALLGEDLLALALDDGRTLGLDSLRLASSRSRGSNRSHSSAAREGLLPPLYSLRDARLPPCRLIPPGDGGGAASLVMVTAGKTLPLRTTVGAPAALTDLVLPLLPIPGPFQKSPEERWRWRWRCCCR